MQTIKCDIIISGAGMAGLSLLYRAMKMGVWTNEKIIIIEKEDKHQNDKTWSFWKKDQTVFDELIYCDWDHLSFFSNSGKRTILDAHPYTYNSIRSIDFYTHVLSYLKQFPNLIFHKDEVISYYSDDQNCFLKTSSAEYVAKSLFNSVYKKPPLKTGDQYFLQHFKGIKLKTKQALELSDAYLMDFRTSQEHGASFFYTLPTSTHELFVEYTVFSKSLLEPGEYDRKITAYLEKVLQIDEYELLEQEFGVIPMTDYEFKRFDGKIINLGTAGGDTRASTGYTFINTQKTIGKILAAYQLNGHPFFNTETVGVRHHLYDTTLLNVLDKGEYEGHQLFSDLFSKTRASVIFSFLDAETFILQDLQIMKSLKPLPFFKAFIGAVYRRLMLRWQGRNR